MRVLIPTRRKPPTPLANGEEVNRKISSDRVVVDNYFGRLCSLWALCLGKYCWQVGCMKPILELALL
ncbi:hypothetical protein PHMEG_00011199 [Phytophthora megakarya]|uniref:DDE Tnp4 domain-containing protein n=1 Tax=Phytophthora megakarya TaxID=4795 RepID=A0A225WCB4_9STRA|nr:hypothetical protein PHMEG_00011199 [Phytophthora megakarya]